VCHGPNGSGAQPTNVKLSEVVESISDKDLRDFIAVSQESIKMPAFGKTLSDAEMADLIAFMRSWKKSP
jgi:mono/diheme cytochrome c family protein